MTETNPGAPATTPAAAADVRRGALLRLRVEGLAFGARGLARVGGYVVFVDGALPGQEVAARVYRRKRDFAEAAIEEVLLPAPGQVIPACRHFGVCGGCALQHWDYALQLESKRQQVADVLRRISGVEGIEVAPTVPSPEVYGYRNKMEFSFSRRRWLEAAPPADSALPEAAPEPPALGLHPRGRFGHALEIEECHLGSPRAVQVLRLVRRLAAESGLPAYTTRTHEGFWRYLVVREGKRTGDLLVNIVTNRYAPGSREEAVVRAVAEQLVCEVPGVSGVVSNLTARPASTAYGEEERLLLGRPEIREVLGEVTFEISADSFFQTNTLQAERLFARLIEHAALTGRETVLDLYCGTGAISLLAARCAARVIGIEGSEAAVADAERNASLNGITNVEFMVGDLRDALRTAPLELPAPDVVILDPPRAGAHPRTIADVARLGPSRILYVSCNPATLARDLAPLAAAGYRAGTAEPFDMFPHTPHVEVLLPLTR
jgi:23S rRNA (uracil1939-C5)-methyltransferase